MALVSAMPESQVLDFLLIGDQCATPLVIEPLAG
jgi:hypothetical protein